MDIIEFKNEILKFLKYSKVTTAGNLPYFKGNQIFI